MSERSDKWGELETLAKAAESSPPVKVLGQTIMSPDMEAFECHANPAVVLALIAEVRAQAAALERLTEGEDIHERRDLQARLKDAEQALEYYADPTHYIGMMSPGATAREALNHLRKGRPLSQVPNGE